MNRRMLLLLAVLWLGSATAAVPTVTSLPAQPLVEQTRNGRQLNFDLVFANPTDHTLTLQRLEMSELDERGRLVSQRRLDGNGDAATMSIATLANRTLPANGRLVVFNPFERFDDAAPQALRYVAMFEDAEGAERNVEMTVRPRAYDAPPLRFPLDGAVFVHDGHDLLAHHRRLDISGGMATHFGITSNFMRYAHDFVILDDLGRMHRGDGGAPEDWFGYGAPVHVDAPGVVVAASDGMADNRKGAPPPFDREALMKNVRLLFGNHVVIDHGDGRYSLFAHLQRGSVRVHTGQRVVAGDLLGGVGMSGDASLVHLHYQVQSGPGFEEGLPAYFDRLRLRTRRGDVRFTGPVDSGDLVEREDP